MSMRGASLQSQLRDLAKSIVPPLTVSQHKGQLGRIGVVGGSKEYTGAPYYAGISSLKLGADLSFIFCTESAATPIKTYSPELIVIPLLDTDDGVETMTSHWLPRLHALVVGPGLGREKTVHQVTYNIVKEAIKRSLHLVIDADGLQLVIDSPDVLDGCKVAVLTPNVAEFKRLCQARLEKEPAEFAALPEAVMALAKSFENVTVVLKGAVDIISDGEKSMTCDIPGSFRRCGGQGDVLSGSMATWLHWALLSTRAPAEQASAAGVSFSHHMSRTLLKHYGPVMSAAYAACSFTRTCSRMAFEAQGRTMTTPDLIANFSKALAEL